MKIKNLLSLTRMELSHCILINFNPNEQKRILHFHILLQKIRIFEFPKMIIVEVDYKFENHYFVSLFIELVF